jgi:hypothetical protein
MYQPGSPYYTPSGPPTSPPIGTSPTPLNGTQPYNSGDPNNPQTYGPGGTSAPTFNPTPNNNNNGGGGVPNPGDDNNSDFGRGSGANRNPLTPTNAASAPNDVSTPFSQQESRLPRDFAEDTAETYTPFERPVQQASNGQGGGEIQQVNGQSPAGQPANIYAHHPKFNWVQGVVEFDEPSSTWVIMYDDNPQTSDPYGGELTISGNMNGVRLRSGDVVRVMGTLDGSQEDARGKPIFIASKVQKL